MRRRVPLLVLLTLVVLSFAWADAGRAASEKRPPAPPPAVNVNVTVNVNVSRDVKVDVKVEAPFTPVIGSLQLPDVVQRFLGGFLLKSSNLPPSKPEPAPAKK